MVTRYKYTEVEVDLSDFDSDELIEELQSRKGVDPDEMRIVLENIWNKRRTNQDYQRELDELIWGVLGKIV